jgi:hypothetical protein
MRSDHRSYSQMLTIPDFEGRFGYLMLSDRVGRVTFGSDRILNQKFYKSREWLQIRDFVVLRDRGLDLGIQDREIVGLVVVHHMNPMEVRNLRYFDTRVIDPEFLVATSVTTHRSIHYGSSSPPPAFSLRTSGDTKLW